MTWSCPRCGQPFVTEALMVAHYFTCGRSHTIFPDAAHLYMRRNER